MNADLTGLWRLVAFQSENVDNGDVEDFWGPEPSGSLLLTPGGRTMAILTRLAHAELDSAVAFGGLLAYSGTYHIDGDRWITHVETTSFPAWLGAQQERFFSVAGDHLHVRSAPLEHPVAPGRRVRGVLHWRREEALIEV